MLQKHLKLRLAPVASSQQSAVTHNLRQAGSWRQNRPRHQAQSYLFNYVSLLCSCMYTTGVTWRGRGAAVGNKNQDVQTETETTSSAVLWLFIYLGLQLLLRCKQKMCTAPTAPPHSIRIKAADVRLQTTTEEHRVSWIL